MHLSQKFNSQKKWGDNGTSPRLMKIEELRSRGIDIGRELVSNFPQAEIEKAFQFNWLQLQEELENWKENELHNEGDILDPRMLFVALSGMSRYKQEALHLEYSIGHNPFEVPFNGFSRVYVAFALRELKRNIFAIYLYMTDSSTGSRNEKIKRGEGLSTIISARAVKKLKKAGINKRAELKALTARDLLQKLRGADPRTIQGIAQNMLQAGLHFAGPNGKAETRELLHRPKTAVNIF